MARKDYYEILGVPKAASKEEIKKAYRTLAKKHHPDKGGKEDAFKEISEAFSILDDDDKRAKYDRGGYDVRDFGDGGFAGGFAGGFNMDDILGQFFPGGRPQGWRRQNQPYKGSDLRVKIILNLHEIFTGITRKIKYKRENICNHCHGTGAANDSSVSVCGTCKGSGSIQKVKQTIVGTIVSHEICSTCGGTGKIIKTVCSVCNGQKIVVQEDSIDLQIPRSVRGGDILQFIGAGNASINGGVHGNLLVLIEEDHNELFIRQESDLFSKSEISIYDAIFGKNLEIETIDSKIKIHIEPGTQSSTRLRVEGRGLYKAGTDYRGDLYIDVFVFIPKDLTEEEKEIFEKLKDSGNIQPKK